MSSRFARLVILPLVLSVLLSDPESGTAAPDLPEIIEFSVPSGQIPSVFPAGSRLARITRAEYDRLRAGLSVSPAQADGSSGRWLRASHQVRWEPGKLLGRTTLSLDSGPVGPNLLRLTPWSPAILRCEGGRVGSLADGTLVVQPDREGRSSLTIDWEQRSTAEPERYSLEFPDVQPAQVALNLPVDLIPQWQPPIPSAARSPSIPSEGRRQWTFDGGSGPLVLQLRSRSRTAQSSGSPVWVSGRSQVDVDARNPAFVADWLVEGLPPSNSPVPLQIRFSPGLIPQRIRSGAPGPDTDLTFTTEPVGEATLVRVLLPPSETGTHAIRILARVHAPLTGAWTIPWCQPLEAQWLGGRTQVFVGPERTIEAIQPLEGWQLAGDGPDPRPDPEGIRLEFDSTGNGSVGRLTFGVPSESGSAEIRGEVQVDGSRMRLGAAIRIRFDRLAHPVKILMPSGWGPIRADWIGQGLRQPATFHTEPGPGGEPRVIVSAPPRVEAASPLTLQFEAEALRPLDTSAETDECEVELPRLKLEGLRLADDLWRLRSPSAPALRPIAAEGLVWIDPETWASSRRPDDEPIAADATSAASASLLWRWIDAEASLRVAMQRVTSDGSADCWVYSRIAGETLETDWLIRLIDPESPIESLRIEVEGTGPKLPTQWELISRDGLVRQLAEPQIDQRPDRRSPSLLFHFASPLSQATPYILRGRGVQPWTGSTSIALPAVPARNMRRGTVLIQTELPRIAQVTASGSWPTDLLLAQQQFEALARDFRIRLDASPMPSGSQTQALHYGPSARSLVLRTEDWQLASSGGLIEEAVLSQAIDRDASPIRRVRLALRSGADSTFRFRLPASSRLIACQISEQSVTCSATGRSQEYEIEIASESRAIHRTILEILYAFDSRPNPAEAFSTLVSWPEFTWPCLARVVEGTSRSPLTAENASKVAMPSSVLRLGSVAVGSGLGRPGEPSSDWQSHEEVLWRLRTRARSVIQGSESLGSALLKLDSDDVPVVVDRLALGAAGLSPHQRLPEGDAPGDAPDPVDRLEACGIAFVPVGEAIVVSASLNGPISAELMGAAIVSTSDAPPWPESVRQALARGQDRLDRLQSVARWLGEDRPVDRSAIGDLEALSRPGRAWWQETDPHPAAVKIPDDFSRFLPRSTGQMVLLSLVGVVSLAYGSSRMVLGFALLLGTVQLASQAFGLSIPNLGFSTWVVLGLGFGLLAGEVLRVGRRSILSTNRSHGSASLLPAVLISALILRTESIGAWSELPVAPAMAQGGTSIRVVIPSGTADPVVFLLEADLRRLQASARNPQTRQPSTASLMALSARHSIRRLNADLQIQSELELESSRPHQTWAFPLGDALAIRIEVNGHRKGYRFEPLGRQALIDLPEPGRVHLTVVRTVRAGGLGRLTIPLNRVVNASVVLPATSGLRLEGSGQELDAPGSDGSLQLGPTPLLTITQDLAENERGGAARQETPHLEGLLHWTPTPAGDHVLALLSLRGQAPEGPLRFRLEPGTTALPVAVAGLLDWDWDGPPDEPSLVLKRWPRQLRDSAIVVALWRPRAGSSLPGPRSLPRFVPDAPMGYSGFVQVWNADPGHWLFACSTPLLDRVLDPAIPAVNLIPGGTAQPVGCLDWTRVERSAFWLEPRVIRPTLTPAVDLEIRQGRVDLITTIDCEAPTCGLVLLTAQLPSGLQVDGLDGDDVLGWQVNSEQTLMIQCRGRQRESGPSRIRIQAHQPIRTPTLQWSVANFRIPVPWLEWSDAVIAPGRVTVRGPLSSGIQLIPVAGADSDSTVITEADQSVSYATATVHGSAPSLELLWRAEPPRADVSVWSRLTTDPGELEWQALVQYDLISGPRQTLRLELPTEWADAIQVDAGGPKFVSFLRAAGSRTVLNLSFTQPQLGRLEISIRGRIPSKARTVNYPDLVPIGRGRVQRTLLAWSNGSGERLSLAGTSVQEIDRSRFQSTRLSHPEDIGDRYFQVAKVGWKLQFDPSESPGRPDSDSASRRVIAARAELIRLPVKGVLGQATYRIASGPGSHLRLRSGADWQLLDVLVDGKICRPLQDPVSALWRIPLTQSDESQVVLTWAAPLESSPVFPAPLEAEVPTAVCVLVPPGTQLAAQSPSFQRCDADAYWNELLSQKAATITGLAQQFNRSSEEARSRLLRALFDFEHTVRTSRRASLVRGVLPSVDGTNSTSEVFRALQQAGLEEIRLEVRQALGLESAPGGSPRSGSLAEDPAPRLPRLGEPWYFVGSSTSDAPVSLAWSESPSSAAWYGRVRANLASLVIGPSIVLSALLALWRRRWIVPGLIAITAAVLAGWTGGTDVGLPSALLVGAFLAALSVRWFFRHQFQAPAQPAS